jgi:hypothetical protein
MTAHFAALQESGIGTFRTWRDVRLESVMRTKADSKIMGSRPRCRRSGGRDRTPGPETASAQARSKRNRTLLRPERREATL